MATPQAAPSKAEKILNAQARFAMWANHKPACVCATKPNAECSCGASVAIRKLEEDIRTITSDGSINTPQKWARKRERYEQFNGRWATHKPTCKRMVAEIQEPNISFSKLPACSCGFFTAQATLADDLRKA